MLGYPSSMPLLHSQPGNVRPKLGLGSCGQGVGSYAQQHKVAPMGAVGAACPQREQCTQSIAE